ncbi:MAG: hypothetical protein WAO28_03345 [Candidatus Microsaccharimonas sp.]
MTKKEKEALLAQIADFLPELKLEIDGAKSDLKNARTLKTQIEGVFSSSDELLKRLQDPESGADAVLNAGSKGLETISEDEVKAKGLLVEIDTALESVNQHISDMETAYNDFNTIKKQIDDPETGLEVTLTNIKNVRARAKESATKTENILKDADSTLIKVNARIKEIDTAYELFLASNKKINDPTSGLEAILKAVQKLRDDISSVEANSKTLFTQISGYKDEAVKSLDAINGNKDDSETTLKTIKQYEADSVDKKEKIDKLFKIASQTASTAYFKRRTNFVMGAAILWLVLGVGVFVWAVLASSSLVQEVIRNNNIPLNVVIARIAIITPLLVFTFYALRQYGKERSLVERYAFKEISGATIEGHIEMVRRAVPNATKLDDELLSLAVDVVDDVHTEPDELNKTEVSRTSVKSNGQNIELTNEVKEALVKTKEVLKKPLRVSPEK